MLALTLGLVFRVDQLGNTIAHFNDQNSNNADIVCNTVTAYTEITSDGSINGNNCTITNTLGCYTLNSNFVENSVSLSSGRIYTGTDLHVGNNV